MQNKYPKLLIVVATSFLILPLSGAFTGEVKDAIKAGEIHKEIQEVNRIESSSSEYKFPWYVIASGGGSTSSGSHRMKFTSVGQVFTGNAQGGSHKIFSGYISTASYPYTEVKEVDEDQVPYSFELFQNYPNPFNPTTNIRFNLSKSGHVRLVIYNILGRRVTTLVDEDLPAGHKLVTWDGKDDLGKEVASGVYFYRIKAGDFVQSKKMVLMK